MNVRILPGFAAFLLAAACGIAHAQPGAAPGVWYGDLASSRAFMVDAAKLYQLRSKNKVTVQALNTIKALEALSSGQVELVSTARPGDARTAAEQNLEFMPVAWDALVLVTHPSNKVSNLSLKQLRDIYFGRIKTWQVLGGAAKPINLYSNAAPLDGVEYSLRKILFGNGAALIAAQRWYVNTKQLEDAIAIDPIALGVSTLSNVIGNKGLKVLTIEGVSPSIKTLEDGQYLLAAPLYVAARREASGQPPSTVQLARKALDFFRDEPALKAAWRKKQLVPFTEAKKLAEIVQSREQWIIAELGIKPPLPPAPPWPPAPAKGKQLNRPQPSAESLAFTRGEKDPAARGAQGNPMKPVLAPRGVECRPAPACVVQTAAVPAARTPATASQ